MEINAELILALSSLVAAFYSVYKGWADRKAQQAQRTAELNAKNAEQKSSEASAANELSDAAVRLVAPLTQKIESLEIVVTNLSIKVSTLERDNEDLADGVRKLIDQIVDLGHIPVYTPGGNYRR
jgi:hypothetical protein